MFAATKQKATMAQRLRNIGSRQTSDVSRGYDDIRYKNQEPPPTIQLGLT